MTQLRDKVVLVTGASMGIGAAIARALVQEGCRVVFAARSFDKLERAASEYGPRALAVRMDVTSDDSVFEAVDRIERELGRIDVVANNAGSGGGLGHWHQAPGQTKSTFDVHFFGAERVMRAVVPLMLRQGGGTIVNFTSTLGYVAMPGTASYNAAKAAIVMLSRTLRAELGPRGVDVRLFGPPHTRTESGEEMPLNLPKIFEPEWVAQAFVRFLEGRRAEALVGGNEALLYLQRLSPSLAGHIMKKIGFGALERLAAKQLPATAGPTGRRP